MYKFKSFIPIVLAILMSIPARALTWPEASTADSPKLYYIKNFRSNKYAKWVGNGTNMLQTDTPDAACMFWFEGKQEITGFDNGEAPDYTLYTLHNICTNQVFRDFSSWVNGTVPVSIFPSPQDNNYFCLSLSEGHSCAWNDWGGEQIGQYYGNDGGSIFDIVEVPVESYPEMVDVTWNLTDGTNTIDTKTIKSVKGKTYSQPFDYVKSTPAATTNTADAEQTVNVSYTAKENIKFSDSYENATWYRIKVLRNPVKYTAYDKATGKYMNSTTAPTALSIYDMFAFVGNETDGFKILNAGAGNKNALGGTRTLSAVPLDQAVTWELVNVNGNNLVIRNKNNKLGYINDNNNVFAYWYHTRNTTDGGSTFEFEEISQSEAQAELNKYANITIRAYYEGTLLAEESKMVEVGTTPELSANLRQAFFNYSYDKATVEAGTTEVTATATWNSALCAISDTREDAKWNLCTVRGKQLAYEKSTNAISCTALAEGEEMSKNIKNYFALVGSPLTGFKIYNAAMPSDQAFGGTVSGNVVEGRLKPVAAEEAATFKPVMTDGHFTLLNISTDQNNAYINENNNGGYLAYWISSNAATDNGSTWTFSPATEEENTSINNTKIVNYNMVYNGNTIYTQEEYVAVGSEYPTPLTPAFTTVSAKPEGTVSDNGTYNLTVDFNLPFTTSSDYANAKWYIMKNKEGENYTFAYNNGSTEKYPLVKGTANVDGALWAFLGDPFNGFRILNKKAGDGKNLKVALPNNGAYPTMSADEYRWAIDTSDFGENKFCLGKDGFWLNNWGNNYDLSMWQQGKTDRGSAWNVIDVEGETTYADGAILNIGTTLTATTVQSSAFCPADGMTAYSVSVSPTWTYATLQEVTGNVPANEPVVLKAVEKGNYVIGLSTEDSTRLEGNSLTGSATESKTADGTQYILANGDNGLGFYPATDGTTIPAGKAYLQAPSAGAKAIIIVDEETAVNAIEAAAGGEEPIYNLSGQRMGKVRKGLNIVGGKKVIY